MNPEAVTLLNLRRLPARLLAEQGSLILGVAPHDMPVLAAEGILRPLNYYSKTAVKVYAAEDVLALAQDRRALAKMTRVIYDRWRLKNSERPTGPSAGPSPQE